MTVDPATRAVYDASAAIYEANRTPWFRDRAGALASQADGTILDIGCGTGAYLDALDARVVGLDASLGMLDRARGQRRPLVQADLGRLPVRRRALRGAWARNSYLHVPHGDLPLVLAEAHRAMESGAPIVASFLPGPDDHYVSDDDLPGRNFWRWSDEHLIDVFTGAGFVDVALDGDQLRFVTAVASRTLPDTVGPEMRLLVCGLNPSLHAADAGVGFVTPGNRFWPAAVRAGLAVVDRDPWDALRTCGMGMTDLVKRATRRADELDRDEYRSGLERLDRLCHRLAPEVVCVVGLAGWRAAVDRKAGVGWQAHRVGDRPVYLLPSTSGLNAHTKPDQFVEHLRTATAGPPPGAP